MAVVGVCTVKYNGKLYKYKKGVSIEFGGPVFMPQMANGTVVGHANDPTWATIDGIIVYDSTMGPNEYNELNNLNGATAEFETDAGQVWIVEDCAKSDGFKLTSGEGECAYKITGKAAEQTR